MDLADGFRALVRRIVGLPDDEGKPPQIDRLAHYRARVDLCAADGSTLDITPEDPRISPEKNVRLLVGVPGQTAIIQPGAIVWLGWDAGNPARPHCLPCFESASVIKLVLNATQVLIGADGLTPPVNGVVLAKGIDTFTGIAYGVLGNASLTVMAKP